MTEKTQPLILTSSEGITFFFEVQPTGTSGFAFMVTGKNFKFKFLNSLQPKGLRPSVMVDIASETLWEHGPHKAVEIVFDLLTLKGAEIKSAKPSRVDLCFDIFLPESIWNPSLIDFAVCRAKKHSLYGLGPLLEGITFGKGQVSCRIYDKMLEIERKSKKWWMLPIWKLTEIPSGMKVIRVEFQLRREALKQLGQEDIWDTLIQCPNLWAYCSQNWLKFQDNPGKHPDQRDTFPWWRIIQLNFAGEQYPSPQVRLKANNADQKRLASQALGLVTSLLALEQGFDFEMLEHMTFEDLLAAFERCISLTDKELKTIREDMSPKLGKKRVEPSESGSGPDWQHEKSVLMDSFYRRVSDPDLLEVPHEQTS